MDTLAAQGLPYDDVSTVRCQGCGVSDGSLRYSAHPAVVSVGVKTNESARVGIWCARCRGIEAAKATAISLLAGWWSLRGPKATFAAVQTNLKGGEQNRGINAEMLRQLARREHYNGNLPLAAVFAGAAHSVQSDRENGRLLHELNKAGYRSVIPSSRWRFAPAVSIVVFLVVLGGLGLKVMTSHAPEPASAAPVQRAALVHPVTASSPPKTDRGYRAATMANMSADQLEKLLTPDSDLSLARAYFQQRLHEAENEIPVRVRHGDDLWQMEIAIKALGANPALDKLLSNPGLKNAYDNLTSVMSEATRSYRGGASVEAIERTSGESLRVTVDIAIGSIEADMVGHTQRSDALASEVDRRADSLVEMKRDLRVRGTVIGLTTKAIDACLQASH
ncbi:MAG TPA: hypothetical protein VNN08_13515 [Thermoanaerobaculia bacterium]|nr:hypothetical protein [Thermoanaerobaculia bacterium]